jgi:hypothetical protein
LFLQFPLLQLLGARLRTAGRNALSRRHLALSFIKNDADLGSGYT